MMRNVLKYVGACLLLVGCTTSVPEAQHVVDETPSIYPDYVGVTIPSNVAPLRFKVDEGVEEAIAVLSAGNREWVEKAEDGKFLFSEGDWKEVVEAAKGDSVAVQVYEKKSGEWSVYQSFGIHVAPEEIDAYLAYRLIPPGYEQWHQMGLYQRDLTSFNEEAIIDNRQTAFNCMNCHSFRMQSPDDMLFHMRADFGGTYVWTDGKLEKLDGKVSESIQSLVYPYWHPSGDYVAFSTNKTNQMFHMKDKNRIEVFDSASDVLVYDVKNHRVLTDSLLFSKGAFETFPSFSPDGKTLYFSTSMAQQMPKDYKSVKYSLCSISFDAQQGRFGNQVDTLYSAEKTGKTAAFPRVSPDGRFLAFAQADYGNFLIWHKEADLYLIDLKDGQVKELPEVNSVEAESYHAWSSNGRWLVFASRRDDGLYSRPYIAYIDENGKGHKPFVVPQHTPDFYQNSLTSYNVPEFIKEPVTIDKKVIVETAREGQALKVAAP